VLRSPQYLKLITQTLPTARPPAVRANTGLVHRSKWLL
jgi:hypothetical protein